MVARGLAQALWHEHAANAVTMEALDIFEGIILETKRGYNLVIMKVTPNWL